MKRGVAKATSSASGGGADDQPKKAKKVSDVKVTAMMESARAEMENQQRKRDAMDIYMNVAKATTTSAYCARL